MAHLHIFVRVGNNDNTLVFRWLSIFTAGCPFLPLAVHFYRWLILQLLNDKTNLTNVINGAHDTHLQAVDNKVARKYCALCRLKILLLYILLYII